MTQKIALDILKTGQNVFITGSAGTGKTYLLNQYISYLRDRNIFPTIVAPTGIASSHLKGQTIHSFFGLGVVDEMDNEFIDKVLAKKYLKTKFSKLQVLIIDEISMVSSQLFWVMNKITQGFLNNANAKQQASFGGVQVVACGDFFQLPPVSKATNELKFAWQATIWKELNFKTCYLNIQFRQNKNDGLIDILNDIRSGVISEKTKKELDNCYLKNLNINYKATKLYTHNIDVDRINQDELNKLPNKANIYTYSSKGSQNEVDKIFNSFLVAKEMVLKKDCIVIFIKNDIDKRYINGTTGVVVDFDINSKMPIVKIASGAKILVSLADFAREDEDGNVIAKVSQIPLKLAWAITIHKSQGMSLDVAQIDLSKTFEEGQGYVALSRVKSINGLKLIGLNDMALQVNRLILKIDNKIKQASQKATSWVDNIMFIDDIYKQYITKLGGLSDENLIKAKQIKREKEALVQDFNVEIVKKEKISTYDKTRQLIKNANSIDDIAKIRKMTTSTITEHLIKIKLSLALENDNDLKTKFNKEIAKFKTKEAKLIKRYKTILKAKQTIKAKNNKDDFSDNGDIKLKAIFEFLDGSYELNKNIDYFDIKMALLFE
jgi:hypothetical protein